MAASGAVESIARRAWGCEMGSQPLSLVSWHTVLLGLAIELASEAAGLVFVSFLTERQWRERALIAVPIAAFMWILAVARNIQAALDYWPSYYAFLYAHYPPDRYPLLYTQTQHDYQTAIAGATADAKHLGWIAVLVTEGMVLLGGALLLYWCGWVWRGSPTKSPLPAPSATPSEAEDGELEITIEPLSRPYRE